MKINSKILPLIKPSSAKIKKSIAIVTMASYGVLSHQNTGKIIDEVSTYQAYNFCKLPLKKPLKVRPFFSENDKIEAQKKLINKIIQEDPAAPEGRDFSKIIKTILTVSNEYNVDPIDIACIVKQESHFIAHPSRTCNGKGLMQITEIVTKDLFERPEAYHKKTYKLIKKYKSSKHLYSDLQNNIETNIRTGVLLYGAILKKTKGNIRLALEGYNGSKNKKAYAESVLSDIKKYKKAYIYNRTK